MKVLFPPKSLLLSSAALFLLVPLSVITAGVFSTHVWWDLPVGHLQFVGFLTLLFVAPVSWRLIMGRPGTWPLLAAVCGVISLSLGIRAAWIAATLQGIWAVIFVAICTGLLAWTRTEQQRSYFDLQTPWYAGMPVPVPGLSCVLLESDGPKSALRIARLDEQGLFAFARAGSPPRDGGVLLELQWGERKIRIAGRVVRQFEDRASGQLFRGKRGLDWGMGVKFDPLSPDVSKEFSDFLEVIRGEGCISE